VLLARKFGGEVVSADSRQLYRGMDIGTGKVTKREMGGIPHHVLDVAPPKRRWTVAQYERAATRAIRRIHGPVWLVGGSPFYVEAALYPGRLPAVAPNPRLRKRLSGLSTGQLYRWLLALDPERAATVEAKNPVRLIRAIEVASALGRAPKRALPRSPYRVLELGIAISQTERKRRIHRRLRARMRAGMLAEVERLHDRGLSWKALEAFGLEYRYLALYLQGKLSKTSTLEQLERAINAFAKRQMTWWKHDPEIRWVQSATQAFSLVRSFL
jgi:tRNA dimethylallyltransferase